MTVQTKVTEQYFFGAAFQTVVQEESNLKYFYD